MQFIYTTTRDVTFGEGKEAKIIPTGSVMVVTFPSFADLRRNMPVEYEDEVETIVLDKRRRKRKVIERVTKRRDMTDDEIRHWINTIGLPKSLPDYAGKAYEISDSDLPESREFRDAWVDVTDSSKVDICCTRAKDIKLAALRRARDKLLDKSDKETTRALEDANPAAIEKLKARRQALRDATVPLKALDTSGKVNDAALLQQIRELAEIK